MILAVRTTYVLASPHERMTCEGTTYDDASSTEHNHFEGYTNSKDHRLMFLMPLAAEAQKKSHAPKRDIMISDPNPVVMYCRPCLCVCSRTRALPVCSPAAPRRRRRSPPLHVRCKLLYTRGARRSFCLVCWR